MLHRIIIGEHERGILFRRGRLVRALDPGAHWIVLGRVTVVSLARRTAGVVVAPTLTRGGVPVGIRAIVTYRVTDAIDAVVATADTLSGQIDTDARAAIARAVSLREAIDLADDREAIEDEAKGRLALATRAYAVEVEDLFIEEVRLPRQLRRAWKRGEALRR